MTLWPIWINRPLVLVADPGVGCLLTSGDARRVAGVSVTNPASLVPTDHHQRSSSLEYWLLSPNSISHHPVPGLWLLFTWYSSMGLLKPHSHTHSSRSLVLPRLTFFERSHLSLFDHCVLTLDCFSCFGLISARLLTILPALILCSCLSSDIPVTVTDHCLYDCVNSY